MSHMIFAFSEGSSRDARPLPLIVAEKWDFSLAYHETDDGLYYSVQDWIRGISTSVDIRQLWDKMKIQLSISIRQLPYLATNGKTYQMDFTSDKGLYLIAQNMRAIKSRPALSEIKRFLAESGAFTDLVRREPQAVITSGAIDPEAAIDAVIEHYRRLGKPDSWINARLAGKVKRVKFTTALQAAVEMQLKQVHYAVATDDIYLGLWERTAQYIKAEMDLPKSANLRDHQPTIALTYQGLAEEVCAQKLGDRVELSWDEARQIIRFVARMIGEQAKVISEYLQMDLATGYPLLPNNH